MSTVKLDTPLVAKRLVGDEKDLDIVRKLSATTPGWDEGKLFSLERFLAPGRFNRVNVLEVMHRYQTLAPEQELFYWETEDRRVVALFVLIPIVQAGDLDFKNHIGCFSKRSLVTKTQ